MWKAGSSRISTIATDPLLDALRKEPEFAEILMRDISAIRHF